MIDIIKDKIKELEERKSNYIEMLESGSIFEDSYVLKQLRICRGKIDILEDVLDEIKERYTNITEEIMNNSENEDYKGIINELEKDLEDIYFGRGKYHMDSDVIGIKDVLDKIKTLKAGGKNE